MADQLLENARRGGYAQPQGRLIMTMANEIERLRAALSDMLAHVEGQEFCYCEYPERTGIADAGNAVEVARNVLGIERTNQEGQDET